MSISWVSHLDLGNVEVAPNLRENGMGKGVDEGKDVKASPVRSHKEMLVEID